MGTKRDGRTHCEKGDEYNTHEAQLEFLWKKEIGEGEKLLEGVLGGEVSGRLALLSEIFFISHEQGNISLMRRRV